MALFIFTTYTRNGFKKLQCERNFILCETSLVLKKLLQFLTFTQFFQIVIEKDMFRSSHRRCSVTKGVRRNFAKFAGKPLCQSLFFNKVADLRPETLLKKRLRQRCFLEVCNCVKKETPAQGLSCEFCEISNNAFCYRTPPMAASLSCNIFFYNS